MDSNRGPLVSEATSLPTEPLPGQKNVQNNHSHTELQGWINRRWVKATALKAMMIGDGGTLGSIPSCNQKFFRQKVNDRKQKIEAQRIIILLDTN